jgi:hypothetical protein
LLLPDNDPANFHPEPSNPAGRSPHLLFQRCAHNPTNLGKDAPWLKLSAKKVIEAWGGENLDRPNSGQDDASRRQSSSVARMGEACISLRTLVYPLGNINAADANPSPIPGDYAFWCGLTEALGQLAGVGPSARVRAMIASRCGCTQ